MPPNKGMKQTKQAQAMELRSLSPVLARQPKEKSPMRRRDVTIRVSLTVLISTAVAASAHPQDTATKLDEYLIRKATGQIFSGSVLVAGSDGNILRKGYGFANLEHRVPNTPETKFRLGSLTKQFTAMAILILQEQGKLSVQDTIGKHLPGAPASWHPITVHQLLTHTSGLMHSWDLPEFEQTQMVPSTLDQTIARFTDQPLLSQPGEKFHYSGLGYFVLAKLIETVSGVPYGTFLRQQILDPLTLNDTGEDRQAPLLTHRASGYIRDGERLVNAPPIDMALLTGGGNLYSTVDDLAKWDRALTAGLLLSKASYRTMYTPFKDNYGYGWFVRTERSRKRIDHDGGVPGFSTTIRRFPDDRVCIIVLSNLGEDVEPIAADLEAIVFEQPLRGAGR